MKLTIRVYGLLVNNHKEIVLSDEYRGGYAFTKFPGGGMEFGEGQKETVIREFKEELDIDVKVGELFYVNDFFQASAFDKSVQVISFYYWVQTDQWDRIIFDAHEVPLTGSGEKHRLVSLADMRENDLTFPIDKEIVRRLKAQVL